MGFGQCLESMTLLRQAKILDKYVSADVEQSGLLTPIDSLEAIQIRVAVEAEGFTEPRLAISSIVGRFLESQRK